MQGAGWKGAARYVALLGAAFVLAFLASVKFGAALDHWAYDFLFQHTEPAVWQPQSVILAIDEHTLETSKGGVQGLREPLAQSLRILATAAPKAVAIDVTLADQGLDPDVDRELAAAFRATPNLVLASDLLTEGWEDPLPQFATAAAALGEVHTQPDADGITRSIALEKRQGRVRRWALSLEALRLSRGVERIIESPTDLQVGASILPVPQKPLETANRDDSRVMRVRFPPAGRDIPRVSMRGLIEEPSLARALAHKVVFVGLTAVTAIHDRLQTPVEPYAQTAGIEINASAFETMAQGLFLTDAGEIWVVLFSLLLVVAAGVSFRYLPGWWGYLSATGVLLAAGAAPWALFQARIVLPFAMPAFSAAFGALAAAGYYHLVVRRNLEVEHAARTRYQQAMQFVTHEMRTPLSAIQGSSELMTRYTLNEDKRQQIAQLINTESKRLARMVEVFLSVERLSAGQMELKREPIPVQAMVDVCVERARPLAERKHIAIKLGRANADLQVLGDRELMEYACYNLLTNAIKYSPRGTEVTISAWKDDGLAKIAVQDQGIGMDQKEVKQIFQKFYRTKKAEESGEAGTGIGLSIVQQIVEQHAGHIDVVSQPGAGSCFTLALPLAHAAAAVERQGR